MSLATRVRAGIALHAAVNVSFAAFAIVSGVAATSAVDVVAGPSPSPQAAAAAARSVETPSPLHAAHPLLLAVEPAPTTTSAVPAAAGPAVEVESPSVRPVAFVAAPAESTEPVEPVEAAPPGSGPTRQVVSTGYCLSGQTASGRPVGAGMVAMNGEAFGTRFVLHDGPLAGATLEVADRIGWGSEFDIWFADCAAALEYGRHRITIERVD